MFVEKHAPPQNNVRNSSYLKKNARKNRLKQRSYFLIGLLVGLSWNVNLIQNQHPPKPFRPHLQLVNKIY